VEYYPKNRNQRKRQKDIGEISIQKLKEMSAEEVLTEYNMVIYSPGDIIQINRGLDLIRQVLKKNSEKFGG